MRFWFIILDFTYYIVSNRDTKVGSYGSPDFAIAKHCFNSLLETAIKANFLLFPLVVILW